MNITHMTIGERIVTLLAEKERKQVELARYMNIGQSTVNGWTKGGRTPSADVLVPICKFLGVSVWFLLTGEEEDHLIIGEKIKMYRRLRDFTQKELAEQSGVSEASIRKYEAGTRSPKKEQLKKLAAALGIVSLEEDKQTPLMENTKDSKQRELYAAAEPLIVYMRNNWNSNAKVIVNQKSAELLIGHMTAHVDYGSGG